MSYGKNFNPGKITIDLPTSNYFHELPLLSFGDVHGALNLSLVFNYGLQKDGENLFNIGKGYKLNLHKKIIMNSGSMPKFITESGKMLQLNGFTDLYGNLAGYTFPDESQRIVRIVGSTYELENPDFSKEIYNSAGRITKAIDKYGITVLDYTYDSSGKLTSVKYRNSRTVTFSYDFTNELSSILYGSTVIYFYFSENLWEDSSNMIIIHNGTEYRLDYSSDNFSSFVSANENSTLNARKTVIEKPEGTTNKWQIIDYVQSDAVDHTTYAFANNVTSNTVYNQMIEVTDNKGVTKRIQYERKNPICSYEINNGEYIGGDISVHQTLSDNYDTVCGIIKQYDGIAMSPYASYQWTYSPHDQNGGAAEDFYILTGWAKFSEGNLDPTIIISPGGSLASRSFSAISTPRNKWLFFAYKFSVNANVIYVYPNDPSTVSLNDLRIIPSSKICDNNLTLINEESILIHKATNDKLLIRDTVFLINGVSLSEYDYVHFDDLLKIKVNYKENNGIDEAYINKCKDVMAVNSYNDFKVVHGNTSYTLDSFYLGKINRTRKGTVTTVIKDDASEFIVEAKDNNGNIISSKALDTKFDTKSVTENGITTVYTRNGDLPLSESVSGLYTRTTSYGTDASGRQTVSLTDEFGNTTVYTLDSVWGNVISVTLPNGKVITDTYDGGGIAKTGRTFAAGYSNTYEYYAGNPSRITSGNLYYDFGYSKGELTSVKKNGTLIEEHEITDTQTSTQTSSYYPSKASPLYSKVATYDNYGRLTSVNGVLENTYELNPVYESNQYTYYDADNSSSKLCSMKDHITDNTTKFAYNADKIDRVGTFNSSDSKICEEIFTYDSANRLKDSTYNCGNDVYVDMREYIMNASLPNADSRINYHTVKVNNSPVFTATNTYDNFKRLVDKKYTFTSAITKSYTYENTRPVRVKHKRGSTVYHNYVWNCDGIGRTTSESDDVSSSSYTNTYVYDVHDRLTRENNAHYGKSIVYTYDSVGNITSAKKYNYTSGSLSGTYTEDTYVYSTSYPDRLTSFNGNSITYDTNGCVKTYNGWTYTWNKGKLGILQKSGAASSVASANEKRALPLMQTHKYTFSYDAYGRRTQKKYNYSPASLNERDYIQSATSDYKYDISGRLLSETKIIVYNDGVGITKKFVFLYDENEIIGVIYTNASGTGTYYYDKNPRGDVIAILDTSGNSVVKYKYDAYGNVTAYGITDYDLAQNNPIRYRSYYFDEDTGLYYLNARYYNPQWRRFISPDDTAYLDPDTVNGLNLYAYCGNDPVNYYDPSGCLVITSTALLIGGLIAAGIGAGIGLGTAIYKDIKEDGVWFNGDWTDYIGRTLGGFIAGFGVGICTVLGAGVGAAILGGTTATLFTSTGLTMSLGSAFGIGGGVAFATGMAGYVFKAGVSRSEEFKVQNMLIEGGANAISGALSVFGGYLGGLSGVHNNVFTKMLSKRWDLVQRILIENIFTVGFKIANALIKSQFIA